MCIVEKDGGMDYQFATRHVFSSDNMDGALRYLESFSTAESAQNLTHLVETTNNMMELMGSKDFDNTLAFVSKCENIEIDNGNMLMVEALYPCDTWYMQSGDDVYRATAFREYNGETCVLECREFSFDNIMAVDGLPAFAKLVVSEEYVKDFQERAQKIEQIHEDYSKINGIQELVTISSDVSFTNDGFVIDLGNVYAKISKSSNDAGVETYPRKAYTTKKFNDKTIINWIGNPYAPIYEKNVRNFVLNPDDPEVEKIDYSKDLSDNNENED